MSGVKNQRLVQGYFHQTAEYWNEVYSRGDVGSLVYQERRDAILQMVDNLGLGKGARVLEIGCGAGHLAVELAARDYDVTAIDPAESMIALVARHAVTARVESRLSVQRGDIGQLEFPDGGFELVIAVGVLPWLDRVDLAVKEMARVVRPGGFGIATVDNLWALHRILDPRLNPVVVPLKRVLIGALNMVGLSRPKARAHLMSPRMLERQFREAGFVKRTGRTLGFGPFTFCDWPAMPDEAGAAFHRRLQRKADSGARPLCSMGGHYLLAGNRI